jgi:phage terminase small subunit
MREQNPPASNVVAVDIEKLRPEPPDHFCQEDAEVWRQTVRAMPPGYFGRETWHLLELYCGHCTIARQLAKEIDRTQELAATSPKELNRFDKLLNMYSREGRVIVRLADVMRLLPRGRRSARTQG